MSLLYDKTTTDQIMSVAISKATGYNTTLVNAGEINNKGVEVQLRGSVLKSNQWFKLGCNHELGQRRRVKLLNFIPIRLPIKVLNRTILDPSGVLLFRHVRVNHGV
jgi:hypothetical protein